MNDTQKDIINPKDLVTEFIDEKMSGELKNLLCFDFLGELEYDRLSDDYKFSEMTRLQNKGEGDPDDYLIVRAVMYLIWKEKLPELSFEDIGTGRKYRGDTLNSFRTLFGRDSSIQDKYGFDDRISEKVETFRKRYLTIGNFILLPNRSVEIFTPCKNCIPKTSTFTLNNWRGSAYGSGLFDYFDQFLIELNECFNGEKNHNDFLNQLLQENDFYFGRLKEEKMQDFVRLNYLGAYLNNKKVIHRFPDKLYHWWRKSPSEDECQIYRSFAERYIDESNKIIQIRATEMLSELQKVLLI